jgi:hypothetical protein
MRNWAAERRDPSTRFYGRCDIVCYHHGGVAMANVLIRDIPEDVLAGIDANAKRLGLSRVEYLRRALVRERTAVGGKVGVEDLAQFSETFADLGDPDVMRRAWE